MSNEAKFEEQALSLQEDVDALTKELVSVKAKLKRSTDDYKTKLKTAAKDAEEGRKKEYKKASAKARKLTKKVKAEAKLIRQTDRSTLGVAACVSLDGQLALLRKLFGDV